MALGLGIGLLVAEFIVYFSIKIAEKLDNCKVPEYEPRGWRSDIVLHCTGVLERLAYIVLIVSQTPAVGAFIGTWILAKIATGWNVRQQLSQALELQGNEKKIEMMDKRNRRAFVSLLGSLLSLLLALLGAYLWHPELF